MLAWRCLGQPERRTLVHAEEPKLSMPPWAWPSGVTLHELRRWRLPWSTMLLVSQRGRRNQGRQCTMAQANHSTIFDQRNGRGNRWPKEMNWRRSRGHRSSSWVPRCMRRAWRPCPWPIPLLSILPPACQTPVPGLFLLPPSCPSCPWLVHLLSPACSSCPWLVPLAHPHVAHGRACTGNMVHICGETNGFERRCAGPVGKPNKPKNQHFKTNEN